MNEYSFKSFDELKDFLDSRKNDKERHYYFGDIDCMNDDLYTIEDIKNEAESSWFDDGAESSIYEFELNTFYAYLSEREGNCDIEVLNTADEAVDRAKLFWDYLTEKEKNSKINPCHESAVVAWCYLESQILNAYNTIWEDGNFVDPSEYDRCATFNEQCRYTAEIIRMCMSR